MVSVLRTQKVVEVGWVECPQYTSLPSQLLQPVAVGGPLPSLESLTFACRLYKWDSLLVAFSSLLLIILHGEKVEAGDRGLSKGKSV